MKLHVVISLVALAGYIQMSDSCCRKDDLYHHQCTLHKKIGIIRAALKQTSCDRATACPLTAENICKCHKEPVCSTKPLECAPVCPVKLPACPTSRPPCPSIPTNPCSCQEKTPLCPFVPVKPCACHQDSVSVDKQCDIKTPVCPPANEKSCACPGNPITQKPCVDKAPLCLPIPVKVPPCQEKTPVCPIHVEKPCDCHVLPPVCQTVTEKKPCHCPQPCSHHMVIPIANVSNIFANSMFLGIPCKQHASDCVKHTTLKTTTTTTTCAPPEPTCYVCIPCKSKQCKEIINKIKLYVTGGKEPCVVCDD